MTDRSTHENLLLDSLGDELGNAVRGARDRNADETIMARIAMQLVSVEWGDPVEILASDMTPAEAIAFLATLI